MPGDDWSREYARFLEERIRKGDVELRDAAAEQRRHPRFALGTNIVWTRGEFQFGIVDLSISGVAFDSNRSLPEDAAIVVRLGDLVSVRARVVATQELESTPMFFPHRYRIRCRFEDELEGMRFLVLVKDMKQLRIEL